MKPTNEILAYMAGIIDGEGCLTIGKQIRKDRVSPSYRCSITVSNTDRRLVDLFSKYYGGHTAHRKDSRVEKKWADSYTWYCPDGSSVEFLLDIKNYLLIKHKQAEILIKFQELKTKYRRKSLGQGKGTAPLSDVEIADKEKHYLKIKALNTKGIYSRSLK